MVRVRAKATQADCLGSEGVSRGTEATGARDRGQGTRDRAKVSSGFEPWSEPW